MAERRGSRMPSMETIIIVAFFLFFALWGVSKCNDSRAKARLAAEARLTQRQRDSIARIALQPLPQTLVQPVESTQQQPQTAIPVVTTPVPAQNSRLITPNMPQSQPQTSLAQPQQPTTTTTTSTQQLYVHEPSLNVRTEPNLTAKSLGTLSFGASVTYLSKTSDTQELSVGAKTVDEPWFKIRTKRGTIGWVYGGYVKFYAPKK